MSAPIKYIARTPPGVYQRAFLSDEHLRIQTSLTSLVELLKALDVPVEIGPPNSGGAGFRALIIPN